MLWAALVSLIFTGGAQNLAISKEDYRETKAEIMEVMENIEQRQEVIRLMYGLRRQGKKLSKRFLKQYRPIVKELRQDEVNHEVLQNELAAMDAVKYQWREEVIRTRFKMVELMSPEEWEAVFGHQ